ncbi:LysR family transcriptional regulator [Kineosporia babensis]|uniref:LysR family transcriptional regulator n=1 Tax=Kineosporia babensis TaxID=499548 RepID=A0A9X1NHB0_9ACTN|nr:LysR family transcriptional regulator [Kineosporia babensis]MCD5313113.1 LysR family transcriptional regulator [Kineosporia babensis]
MPLSPRVPELAALDLLLSVARTGSLGGAAREHGISQQAASERIRRLEGTLGVQVLRRSRQGSSLTTAGALVADWAGQLTDLAAGLEASVSALRAERHARLRVAASLTVAEYLMPRWLVTLRHQVEQRGDELSVQLTATNSEEVAERVRDGRAGLGFVEGPSAPDDLAWREIGTDALVLVVPADHAWSRRRKPIEAAELARTALVSREAGSGTRRALEVALAVTLGHGYEQAEPLLELSGTAAVRGAVLAGAGPAVLSSLAVADDVASGRLRTVPVTGLALDRRLLAVWPLGSSPRGPASDLLTIAVRGRAQR